MLATYIINETKGGSNRKDPPFEKHLYFLTILYCVSRVFYVSLSQLIQHLTFLVLQD